MSGATSWSRELRGRFKTRGKRDAWNAPTRPRIAVRPLRQRRFERTLASRPLKKRSSSLKKRLAEGHPESKPRTENDRPSKLGSSLGPLITPTDFGQILPGQLCVAKGRSGDHPSVYQTLLAVFQAPSRNEFQSQLEDPFYEPIDRLLVRRGHRVLSHLHLTKRIARFGQVNLPIAGIHWLVTLPEFRSQGFASRLLSEAEQQIASDGSLLAVIKTSIPHFWARSGWAVCGRHSFSQGSARLVLRHLHDEYANQLARPLSIRLWRHVEMPALMRIYQQNTRGTYGPLERTEAYWRWLISRRAYDALLVAIDGRDRLELEEETAPIVGYAALRQGRIIELLAAPDHPTADFQLLARACAESVERDRQELFVDGPPEHRIHGLVTAAGGMLHNTEVNQTEVFMVKIIDQKKMLTTISPELDIRAKQAELRRGTELGLSVGKSKWRLVYTNRGMRIRTGPLGRNYLTMNQAEFTRLVLGHGNVHETADAGRISASTQASLDLAGALFPKLPRWCPSLDDLPAS